MFRSIDLPINFYSINKKNEKESIRLSGNVGIWF